MAEALVQLIGNEAALGETFHITQDSVMKWKDILEIYLSTIESVTGNRPKVMLQETSQEMGKVCGRGLQRKYDRLYDRVFDNSKISKHYPGMKNAISMESGLRTSVTEFLNGDRNFREIDWKSEGYMDKVCHEHTPISKIPGSKNKIKYLLGRYTSFFENRRA